VSGWLPYVGVLLMAAALLSAPFWLPGAVARSLGFRPAEEEEPD